MDQTVKSMASLCVNIDDQEKNENSNWINPLLHPNE